jgi:hypothetical protein
MKIIKDNTNEKTERVVCDFCGSIFEYDENDIHKDMNGNFVKCPCCSEEIIIEDAEETTRELKFPDSFFHFSPMNKNAFTPSEKWVNDAIKNLIKTLHDNKHDDDYSFSATGTRMIIVRKHPDDISGEEAYDVLVTNDYHEASDVPYNGV